MRAMYIQIQVIYQYYRHILILCLFTSLLIFLLMIEMNLSTEVDIKRKDLVNSSYVVSAADASDCYIWAGEAGGGGVTGTITDRENVRNSTRH